MYFPFTCSDGDVKIEPKLELKPGIPPQFIDNQNHYFYEL